MRLNLINQTIKSQRLAIGFYTLNTIVICLIISLKYSVTEIIYPLILSIVILIGYLIICYLKLVSLTNDIDNLKRANHQVGYHPDVIDQYYIELIDTIHTDYRLQFEQLYGRNRRNEQFLSQFFHNMKTSVAVIELASSRDDVNIDDIRQENDKLKLQLEQSLNVLRLDRFVQDYMPESYSLKTLVTEVINEQKSNFIYHQIYPQVTGDDCTVFTDRKWFKYMLEQIVSNAIKYSNPESSVEFEISDKQLIIRDHGIGIKPNELERIFDLFYTGTNGRDNKQSTGIGLSMVKTVSEMLDIEVEVNSTVGSGTTFSLSFLTKM